MGRAFMKKALGLLPIVAVSVMLFGCGTAATTMRILNTVGEVTLSHNEKAKDIVENLRLESGDLLNTGRSSEANVSLDDFKVVTMDENSKVSFSQEGKKLGLNVEEGALFFNVTKPLDEEEAFDITTSTMIVGIRGTSGYVNVDDNGNETLIITDGKVVVTCINPSSGATKEVTVNSGEKLTVLIDGDNVDYTVEPVYSGELPEFVKKVISDSTELTDKVLKSNGWKDLNEMPEVLEEPESGEAEEIEAPSLQVLDLSFLDGASWKYAINENLFIGDFEDQEYCHTLRFFDITGKLLHEQVVDLRLPDGGRLGWQINTTADCYSIGIGDEYGGTLTIYDYNFNTILEKETEAGILFTGDSAQMDDFSYNGMKRVFLKGNPENTLFCFDVNKRAECSEEAYNALASQEIPNFDTSKWSLVKYQRAFDGYFVATQDESSWGYIDHDGNELAMYMDASAYSEKGFALVSDDCITYDLIDANQNIVVEDVIEAAGASCNGYGNVFIVKQEDETKIYVVIK